MAFGSIAHFWYKFLDTKFPGTGKSALAKKLVCEAIACPPFLLFGFVTVGSAEGKTLNECVHNFRENLLLGVIVSRTDRTSYLPSIPCVCSSLLLF